RGESAWAGGGGPGGGGGPRPRRHGRGRGPGWRGRRQRAPPPGGEIAGARPPHPVKIPTPQGCTRPERAVPQRQGAVVRQFDGAVRTEACGNEATEVGGSIDAAADERIERLRLVFEGRLAVTLPRRPLGRLTIRRARRRAGLQGVDSPEEGRRILDDQIESAVRGAEEPDQRLLPGGARPRGAFEHGDHVQDAAVAAPALAHGDEA